MAVYDVLGNTTFPAFLDMVQPMLLDESQETTIRQSDTSSWFVEPIGNQLQDNTFKIISSTWHRTISPSLNLGHISSQIQAAADGARRSGNSMCVTNTSVSEVTGSSRCSKWKCHTPGNFGNQIKRRRIQDTALPDSHSLPRLCELDDSREIHECISNLLHMASHGEQTVSSDFVERIIETLVSTLDASMPEKTLCRYHKDASNRIEMNRLASMEALRLLQSTRIFKLQKLVHKEWHEAEKNLLFDLFVHLPSQDTEPEEFHGPETSRAVDGPQIEMASRAVSPRTKYKAIHVQKYRKVFTFSKQLKHGRIDIRASSRFPLGQPETYDYTSEVLLTLPTNEFASAQIRFFLSQKADPDRSIFMTPMISVRPMRPRDSKIFQVAAFGTVEALIDMILAEEASLADRDEKGRSLINVSVLTVSDTDTDKPVVCN